MNAKVGGEVAGADSVHGAEGFGHPESQPRNPQGGLVEHLDSPGLTEQISMLMFGHGMSMPVQDDSDNSQHTSSRIQ